MIRAEQAELFARPEREYDAARKLLRLLSALFGKRGRECQQRRDPRGVVARPIVNLPFLALDAEAAGLTATDMIEVRADQDILGRRGRILAAGRQHRDNV